MEVKPEETAAEVKRLKACINDLISVLALPAIWSGAEPPQVIGALLDALVGMLRLDFAYAELPNSTSTMRIQQVRIAGSGSASATAEAIGQRLNPWLKDELRPTPLRVSSPLGNGEISIAPMRLGLHGEIGWLVAASQRTDFPSQIEKLLLNVAANQAAIGLQETKLLSDQKRIADALDQKVAQRTKELASERDRLQLLLEINKALVANHDLRNLLKTLAPNLRRVTGCDFIGLALPDPDCGLREFHVDYGQSRGVISEGMAVPLEGSASGKAFLTRQLVCLDGRQGERGNPDIYGSPEGEKFYQMLLKEGVPSGYFVPLIHQGEVIAVMQLTKYAAMPLKTQTTEFLNALATQLAAAVANALEHRAVLDSRDKLAREQIYLREEIDRSSMFEEIVGTSPAIQSVLTLVTKVAPTDSTVLITGETGTGKELIARAIHKRSTRAGQAFVSVNCAAIPISLIGAELFGHEKGAFTGATQRRLGRFDLAQGGTLFLDEIGELPAETQVALLRVLQENEFERVGGTQRIPTNVRLIAATNRDLKAAIIAGRFRSDLFYRLNVFPIEMPSLRSRAEDIPTLTEYFIHRYAGQMGKSISGISKRTLDLFQSYRWPGNIRELQNVVERSMILCETEMFSVDESWLAPESHEKNALKQPLPTRLATDEKALIETALAGTRGRISGPSGAAVKLGMPASTLESKIRALKINKHLFKAG